MSVALFPGSSSPHSGPSVKKNCLDSLGRNGTEPAKVLGVARRRLSRVLNGHAAISPIDGDLPRESWMLPG